MKKSKKITSYIFPTLIWTLLAVWSFIFMFIIVWAIITSLKSGTDFYYNPTGLPQKQFGGWKFTNYGTAVSALSFVNGTKTSGFFDMTFNSILYAGGCSFLAVMTACIASYCVAKYNGIKWVGAIWGIVLITNYMPVSTSLASNIKLLTDLNLYDKLYGMYLWSCGAFGATFLLYYATWKGLSWGYAEAAFIDGASHWAILTKIMLPMTKTIFGVLFLSSFITQWNDYLTPMIYLQSMPTIAYGAWQFQFNVSGSVADITVRLAGLIIIALPIFVIFMLFKEKLMGSLTLGGLKG